MTMKDNIKTTDSISIFLNGKPVTPQKKSWICPRCGIDRTKAACLKGRQAEITGECPMSARAQKTK
jgi:hypothetical protein